MSFVTGKDAGEDIYKVGMPSRVVLVIDDDETVRTSTCLVLEASEYRVLNAKNAQDGFHTFTSNHVDLVILEFRLPDDGTWVGQEMKRNKPRVPIAVLSGFPEAIEARPYADELIAKPIDPPELLKKVAALIAKPAAAA